MCDYLSYANSKNVVLVKHCVGKLVGASLSEPHTSSLALLLILLSSIFSLCLPL